MRKTIAKIILCLFGLGFIILLGYLLYLEPFVFGILYGCMFLSLILSFSFVEVFGIERNYKIPSNYKVTAKDINDIKIALEDNDNKLYNARSGKLPQANTTKQ
jgi:hypothetical protein